MVSKIQGERIIKNMNIKIPKLFKEQLKTLIKELKESGKEKITLSGIFKLSKNSFIENLDNQILGIQTKAGQLEYFMDFSGQIMEIIDLDKDEYLVKDLIKQFKTFIEDNL